MSAPGMVVVGFAGGGGSSEGIKRVTGCDPDVAINHDPEAVAMHAANHPATLHYCQNIWRADPRDVAKRRRVGLLWLSPDCRHFSKAKGGQPVKKNIRDLAWVAILWAKRAKPDVIMLENVEEFRDWGPLIEVEGGKMMPCPLRKGFTFKRWVRELQRCGYKVEHRELRACDYGAPTIRKRLFLIARRDGKPIMWPAPTHGPDRLPYRTAAEVIDWSLPCPSIFLTRAEGRAIGVNRPLADATMARIARGVKRYVLDAADPFIVRVDQASAAARNGVHSIDEPTRTATTAGGLAVVQPFLAGCGGRAAQSPPKGIDQPMNTVTAKADQILVTPFIAPITHTGDSRVHGLEEPLRTVTTAHRGELAFVAPTLVQTGYGERPGQEPRALDIAKPLGTVVAGGAKHAVVAAHLTKFRGGATGQDLREPVPTVTANSYVKRPGGAPPLGVVSAFLAQHNTGVIGHDARDPVSTIVGKGCTQGVVAAMLSHQYSSNTAGGQGDPRQPLRTVTTGGHHALVQAFLLKYFGTGTGQDVRDPLHTVSTKDRFGLVTVAGQEYEIADIGMRMLSPRELFRAQGFRDDYVIDRGPDRKPLTKTAQIRMCGNSVCPDVAAALVRANCAELVAERVAA